MSGKPRERKRDAKIAMLDWLPLGRVALIDDGIFLYDTKIEPLLGAVFLSLSITFPILPSMDEVNFALISSTYTCTTFIQIASPPLAWLKTKSLPAMLSRDDKKRRSIAISGQIC